MTWGALSSQNTRHSYSAQNESHSTNVCCVCPLKSIYSRHMVLGFFLLLKYSALSFFSSKHNRARECRLSLSAQMESAPIDVLGLFPRSRYSAPFLFSSKYNRI